MEKLTLHLTRKEYDLATEYQKEFYEIFDKCLILEELFKTALFINHFKIKQKNKLKASKQTTFKEGGLIA